MAKDLVAVHSLVSLADTQIIQTLVLKKQSKQLLTGLGETKAASLCL